jgi:hypothetical protein
MISSSCDAATNDCGCDIFCAVRVFTRDGRWSTYDVSVLKLSYVSFRGKCTRKGNTLKIPSPTKLARLGHFPPASQAGRLAGPVFYVYVFSLVNTVMCSMPYNADTKTHKARILSKYICSSV